MRKMLVLLVLFICQEGRAQGYLRANEQLVFSFQTTHKKLVYLVRDKADKYMLYRFGTKDKIEFEYPTPTKDSWEKFTYSFYLRGLGAANEGMDLNYIYFTHEGFRYVIYDTYYAVGEKWSLGIKVTDLKTGKTTDIRGDVKTRKGSLIDFRDNGKLKIGEDLFD